MTGYGRGRAENSLISITVEVRSVNSKALRVRYGLPRLFNPFINEVSRKVEEFIKRGDLELSVTYRFSPQFRPPVQINYGEALTLIEAARKLSALSGREVSVNLRDILSFPEVLIKEDVDASPFKEPLFNALTEALTHLNAAREAEGARLKAFFEERLAEIEKTLAQIEEELPLIKEKLFKKLKEGVKKLLEGEELGEDFTRRVELEVALLAERQDVSEELSRLKAHIERFREVMEVKDEPIGKTLDFLCQEMHREINTLGSKVKEIDITEPVVKIKGEIAKIKEQVQNVE